MRFRCMYTNNCNCTLKVIQIYGKLHNIILHFFYPFVFYTNCQVKRLSWFIDTLTMYLK